MDMNGKSRSIKRNHQGFGLFKAEHAGRIAAL
jgi:hypothetical protein